MIDIKNGDLPAQPTNLDVDEYFGTIDCPHNRPLVGLTKREAFAMAAMQGLCANSFLVDKLTDIAGVDVTEHITKQAIKQADALLKELEKS